MARNIRREVIVGDVNTAKNQTYAKRVFPSMTLQVRGNYPYPSIFIDEAWSSSHQLIPALQVWVNYLYPSIIVIVRQCLTDTKIKNTCSFGIVVNVYIMFFLAKVNPSSELSLEWNVVLSSPSHQILVVTAALSAVHWSHSSRHSLAFSKSSPHNCVDILLYHAHCVHQKVPFGRVVSRSATAVASGWFSLDRSIISLV